MSFEHSAREGAFRRMAEREEALQEGWMAAWEQRGVGAWVDPEMLRQREDTEWRRWETQVRETVRDTVRDTVKRDTGEETQ